MADWLGMETVVEEGARGGGREGREKKGKGGKEYLLMCVSRSVAARL